MKARLATEPPIEVEGTPTEIMEIIQMTGRELRIEVTANTNTQIKRGKRRGRKKISAKKKGRKRWSEEDVMNLKEYHKKKLPLEEIVELTGRNVNAVKQKITKLISAKELVLGK